MSVAKTIFSIFISYAYGDYYLCSYADINDLLKAVRYHVTEFETINRELTDEEKNKILSLIISGDYSDIRLNFEDNSFIVCAATKFIDYQKVIGVDKTLGIHLFMPT